MCLTIRSRRRSRFSRLGEMSIAHSADRAKTWVKRRSGCLFCHYHKIGIQEGQPGHRRPSKTCSVHVCSFSHHGRMPPAGRHVQIRGAAAQQQVSLRATEMQDRPVPRRTSVIKYAAAKVLERQRIDVPVRCSLIILVTAHLAIVSIC